MDPNRVSKFRTAESALTFVSLGGVPLRAISRLHRETQGRRARILTPNGLTASSPAGVYVDVKASSSARQPADAFPSYFAGLLRAGYRRPAAARGLRPRY
jgi:hypothetical protein